MGKSISISNFKNSRILVPTFVLIIMFCISTFLCLGSGFLIGWSFSVSSSSNISVSKGGTGLSNLGANNVFLGNSTSAITPRPFTSALTSGSTDIVTSGGVGNIIANTNYDRDSILTMSEYFSASFSTTNPMVRKVGNIVFISGPFRVIKDIDASTTAVPGVQMFGMASGWRPPDRIAVACSNNFFGVAQTARVNCIYNGGNVWVQTDKKINSGTYIDLDFTYFLP